MGFYADKDGVSDNMRFERKNMKHVTVEGVHYKAYLTKEDLEKATEKTERIIDLLYKPYKEYT